MMLEQVIDFVTRSFTLDTAGWLVLLSFAAAGYTLIALMLEDHGAAILGAPMLLVGSATGYRAMLELGIQVAPDKLMNMAIGMAGCMLISGLLLVFLLWSWNASMGR
jgi:hypothetical protein